MNAKDMHETNQIFSCHIDKIHYVTILYFEFLPLALPSLLLNNECLLLPGTIRLVIFFTSFPFWVPSSSGIHFNVQRIVRLFSYRIIFAYQIHWISLALLLLFGHKSFFFSFFFFHHPFHHSHRYDLVRSLVSCCIFLYNFRKKFKVHFTHIHTQNLYLPTQTALPFPVCNRKTE